MKKMLFLNGRSFGLNTNVHGRRLPGFGGTSNFNLTIGTLCMEQKKGFNIQVLIRLCILLIMSVAALADDGVHSAELFPNSASTAKWIWHDQDLPGKTCPPEALFRLTFTLPESVKQAHLRVASVKLAQVFLNGAKMSEEEFPQNQRPIRIQGYDVSGHLRSGKNCLAIRTWTPARWFERGVIFLAEIELLSGKCLYLTSGTEVKAVPQTTDSWLNTEYDDRAWKKARCFGDTLSMPWMKGNDINSFFLTPQDKIYQEQCIANGCVNDEQFRNEPEMSANVSYHGDLGGFVVNQQEIPPVLMIFLESPFLTKQAKVIEAAGKADIPIVEYKIYSGRFWLSPGKFDFSYIDAEIRRILKLVPNAKIGLAFRFRVCESWNKAYPEELVVYGANSGKPELGADDIKNAARPSPASSVFRQEVEKATVELARYINAHQWRKRIMYVRLSYGVYGEWGYYGMREEAPDYSPPMLQVFRRFLAEQYGDDKKLQSAWRDPSVTLSTAMIPTLAERAGEGRYLHNPFTERKLLDFNQAMIRVRSDLLLAWAKLMKTHLPGRLCGAYFGDIFNGSLYPPFAQKELDKVLTSPYIDFMSRAYSYDPTYRNIGGVAMQGASPTHFRRYNKLHILEADIRTHKAVKTRSPSHFLRDADETVAVTQRDMANCFLNGAGIQFLSLEHFRHPHWFDSPEFMEAMGRGIKIWRQLRSQEQMHSVADVALVCDPRRRQYDGHTTTAKNKIGVALYQESVFEMNKTGYSVDVLHLDDFLECQNNYRAVIMLNAFEVSPEERSKLKAKLRQPGVTAFWVYAPGLLTPQGFSEESMTDLTGIRLIAKLDPRQMEIKWLSGKITSVAGSDFLDAPSVCSIDPEAQLLALWRDDESPAAVCKKLPDGSASVFLGLPPKSSQQWAELFRQTGCFSYADPGTCLRLNSRLLMCHVGNPGKFTATLPHSYTRVTDLFTGNILTMDRLRLELESSKPSTTWLLKLD